MVKKRLIFTLLWEDGQFVLSRNFRRQKVGDLAWLQKNYDFSNVSRYIDELVVLNVSRATDRLEPFADTLRALTRGCFVPIAAGGGVRQLAHAQLLLRSGADKVVLNSGLFQATGLVDEVAVHYGRQCVVGSVDFKKMGDGPYAAMIEGGMQPVELTGEKALAHLARLPIGEVYLNSMDRDGTGFGYDFAMLDWAAGALPQPIIMAGGVGNALHLEAALGDDRVSAAATAHLFNFVGDGLAKARHQLVARGMRLATWPDA